MKERIYIGTYSNQIEIGVFENGKLNIVNQFKNIEKPSYLHINNDILYAVSETKNGKIYALKPIRDALKEINAKYIQQELPCHIITDVERNKLLVSNYGSGSVLMYKLSEEGTIGKKIKEAKFKDAHVHFSGFIGQEIYVIDLGNDVIYIFDKELNLISKIYTEKGDGPRHLAITENEIIIVTEMSNKLLIYQRQDKEIQLTQKIDVLENIEIESYAGAIKVSGDNKNIYITNRGHDSISVFRKTNNSFELIQNISSGGVFPRDILLNETEEYAFVANQKSNNVVIFKRNKKNGKLNKYAGIIVNKPSCMVRSKYGI